MKRDNSHDEQIVRWATFVRENPKKWREQHTAFINSQIINANEKYDKLKKMPNGKKIIRELRKLRFFGIDETDRV
ncbi:hypothetical protein KAS08_05405 [Candidatus Pacearchaeota archaeon]|nr:hypothetical protein [Candidatus Pacearchaeota archaeon]